jgi:hypothetical protein
VQILTLLLPSLGESGCEVNEDFRRLTVLGRPAVAAKKGAQK